MPHTILKLTIAVSTKAQPNNHSPFNMSSDDGVNSRKRRLEIDEGTTNNAASRATQAQENKRRQIQQSSWGFREVLVECGLLEFATNNGSGDGESFFLAFSMLSGRGNKICLSLLISLNIVDYPLSTSHYTLILYSQQYPTTIILYY